MQDPRWDFPAWVCNIAGCQRKGGFKVPKASAAASGAGGSEDQCAAAAEDAEYLSNLDSIRGLRWCPCPPLHARSGMPIRCTRHTQPVLYSC